MKKSEINKMTRRAFVTTSGAAMAGTLISTQAQNLFRNTSLSAKTRVALVGTGIRGISFYGRYIVENYSDVVEFVGLCDINPGRVAYAKEYIGVDCPVFTDFDTMMDSVPMEILLVATIDSTHDEFIVKALDRGVNVMTEKPLTTDEVKCQKILNAERNSDAHVIMAFNYRYGILFTKLKEILVGRAIGDITSIDFNWYLNTYHGASYFRRWHGLRDKGGTLLIHKASHHFDLLNWYIGSDPVEVHAYGALEKYGKNNSFRGKNCRECPYTSKCKFYYDITQNETYMRLYVENEKYDHYIRDNCLWREEIDIFDKMAVQIKYANNVQVSYSLTAYSPYEGFRLAFNGKEGRLETWEGIPWMEIEKEDQAQVHEKEMTHNHTLDDNKYHEIMLSRNFEEYERIELPYIREGHWGGDKIMHDRIFRRKTGNKELNHLASTRDGTMAVLIGVAARKSIDEGRPIAIRDLTDLEPRLNKWE